MEDGCGSGCNVTHDCLLMRSHKVMALKDCPHATPAIIGDKCGNIVEKSANEFIFHSYDHLMKAIRGSQLIAFGNTVCHFHLSHVAFI